MRAYCKNCDYEFDFTPKNMADLEKINCPKCNNIVSKNDRKKAIYTSKDAKADNTIIFILRILRLFYLFLSVIGIIGYFNNNTKLLIICGVLCIIIYIIERIFDINYLGLLLISIVVSSIIAILKINKIIIGVFFGICCGFIISTVLREIYFFIINLIILIGTKKSR